MISGETFLDEKPETVSIYEFPTDIDALELNDSFGGKNYILGTLCSFSSYGQT